MATVVYQYAIKDPAAQAPQVTQGSVVGVSGTYATNPIFNFDQAFLDGLNSISATEMGRSVPFVSVKILDPSGAILENMDLAFFHKAFDAAQVRPDQRYSERPTMSLKSLELKSDNASGYLYYTNVTMRLKIHKPDALSSTFMMALLFPGMPFLLEYGWNSPNTLLDTKDVLLFAVKTYNVSLDITGQAEVTVEGTAFNERFNNTLVGDVGAPAVKSDKISTEEADGLKKYQDQLGQFAQYLAQVGQRANSPINDYSIINKLAESYKKNNNKARGDVSAKYHEKMKLITPQSPSASTVSFGSKLRNVKCIKFHDLLHILCNDTFQALGNVLPGVQEFRVVYGTFNGQAGRYANKSIAEFPIDIQRFKAKMKAGKDNGRHVPTIEFVLNTLQDSFLENEDYLKSDLTPKRANSATAPRNIFQKPEVISHFISRRQKNPNNPQQDILVMELFIVDINAGLPITVNTLLNTTTASQDSVEQAVAGSTGFPIIRLGHANSYIKNINLTQMADQYMKAALLERMARDRVKGQRSTLVQKETIGAAPVTPLQLPLRGTASMLGHPEWKPFRAFYLSTGFFLIDGIYKILSTTHTISAEGYSSEFEFIWN